MLSDLFWALYLIDVLAGTGGALFYGSFIGLVGLVVYVLFNDANETSPRTSTIRSGLLKVTLPLVLFAQVCNLVPSKDTMYMMLATRMTDHAIESETGQKLLRALNNKIDAFINEIDPPKEKKK